MTRGSTLFPGRSRVLSSPSPFPRSCTPALLGGGDEIPREKNGVKERGRGEKLEDASPPAVSLSTFSSPSMWFRVTPVHVIVRQLAGANGLLTSERLPKKPLPRRERRSREQANQACKARPTGEPSPIFFSCQY